MVWARQAQAAYDAPPRNLIPSSTTLAHVRAEFERAHLGGRTKNATLIEDWRLTQAGQTGSFRVHRLGRDYRETTQLGPLVYENGMHGGLRWQQNRNGITFTYSGFHERDAISEGAWKSNNDRDVRLIGESVPLNAFVIEIDPPNGRHQWLFIDKRTGQTVRVDKLEHNRRVVTTFDDFKPFDGELLPSHIRTVDSLGNEREQTLVSRTLDTTPDPGDVAIVPTRRTLVEFPPGYSAVRLPVRVVNGLLVVRVSLSGRPYDFLLDSGAAGIVIDPIVAESLGLERYGERIGATIGPFPETTAIVPSIAVGMLRMHNVVSRVVSIPFRADDRTRVSGLLGFDFFAEIVVHIDAAHGVFEALHPTAFRPSAELTALPLGLDDKQPAIGVKIGPVAARVILDTGANRTVLESSFAERIDPADETAAPPPVRFRGVGGTGTAEAVRVKDIDLAGFTIHETLVDVSAADLGFEDVDGLIGTDLMRNYDLFFDYRSNTVYARRADGQQQQDEGDLARPPSSWSPTVLAANIANIRCKPGPALRSPGPNRRRSASCTERVVRYTLRTSASGIGPRHLRFEDAPCAAAFVFCPIQREVGVVQQPKLVVDARPGHNDADRCADLELMAGNRIRRTQALHQALRQQAGALRKLGTVLDDGELVATNPRHFVFLAHDSAQAVGHFSQQLVTHRVA